MSKVTLEKSLSTNGAVFGSSVGFALQAMVVETAIVAAKSDVWMLMIMGTLPNGIDVFNQEPEAFAGFLLSQLVAMTKPDPENKDASDTEDDDAGEEDESGEEGEEEGDPEDEPETNGDGGSDNEDEDENGDDDDDEDEGEEDEEEDEEEEELQPPAKKRK